MFQKFIKQFVNVVFFFGPRKQIFIVEPFQSRFVDTSTGICRIDNLSTHYLAVQICE